MALATSNKRQAEELMKYFSTLRGLYILDTRKFMRRANRTSFKSLLNLLKGMHDEGMIKYEPLYNTVYISVSNKAEILLVDPPMHDNKIAIGSYDHLMRLQSRQQEIFLRWSGANFS